ncbi:MAG: hypothetical protein ACOYD4_04595 [Solirubrobacterales bacterium]
MALSMRLMIGPPFRPARGEIGIGIGPLPFIDPTRSKAGGRAWREFALEDLAVADARIRCRRSEPPPPYLYAITLELVEDGEWHTVRLWDNADALDEHHEHAYSREGGKQAPRMLEFASANAAMAAAIAEAKGRVREIVRQWRAS